MYDNKIYYLTNKTIFQSQATFKKIHQKSAIGFRKWTFFLSNFENPWGLSQKLEKKVTCDHYALKIILTFEKNVTIIFFIFLKTI